MTALYIRGIYSTALTKLFLDKNYTFFCPSVKILARFKDLPGLEKSGVEKPQVEKPQVIKISDREDKQGIIIFGQGPEVERLLQILKEHLYDLVIKKSQSGQLGYEVEFPYLSKLELDKLRSQVTPTILYHHRYRIIDSALVELAEENLADKYFIQELENKIYTSFKEGNQVTVYHQRLNSKPYIFVGELIEFDPTISEVVLKRRFAKEGIYDGLGIKKEVGDYAITYIKEGSWFLSHRYYSNSGRLKGILYNINTKVEFYSQSIRYVDLEVDVVAVGGDVYIIDREKLDKAKETGYITEWLYERALNIAEVLCEGHNTKFLEKE